MAAQPIHTKILNAAAREVLRPLGVQQRGGSRVWYDDHGWCVTVIEFKPSGFSKGATLNVSVHWLWYPSDVWSFDLHHDVRAPWVDFRDEAQFKPEVQKLAALAAQAVREVREKVISLDAAYETLAADYAALQPLAPGHWHHLHMGVLAALTGRSGEARACLAQVPLPDSQRDGEQARNRYVDALLGVVDDPMALRAWVEGRIAECRTLLKLETCDSPVLPPC